MKTAIALLAAALLASTLITLLYEFYLRSLDGLGTGSGDDGLLTWFIASIVLVLASFTIGLLLHTATTRLGRVTVWHYLVGSALVGIALAAWQMDRLLTTFFHMSPWDAYVRIGILGLGGCIGVVMGTSFWLIRRPDRDAPPNPPTSPS